jgi:hypothetical protein
MEVSGQLCTPDALDKKYGGPQRQSGRIGEEKNIFPCWELNPDIQSRRHRFADKATRLTTITTNKYSQ